MGALDTVRSFIALVEAKELDAALELCAEDIEYHNIPMPAARGKQGVLDVLGPFLAGASAVEWVVHREAEHGDFVFNERTDRFQMGDQWVEIPVVGVWELRDGKIALWRDYFDLGQLSAQLAG